ncbi:hypothetical protein [Petrachloros mirabilis]
MKIILDSFSGPIADLPKQCRTQQEALRALNKHPRVSTWDMSEHAWVRNLVGDLLHAGLIVEDKSELYPWHRYQITAQGKSAMEADK